MGLSGLSDIKTDFLHRTDYALLNFLFPYSDKPEMERSRWSSAFGEIEEASRENPEHAVSKLPFYLLMEGAVRSPSEQTRAEAGEMLGRMFADSCTANSDTVFMEDRFEGNPPEEMYSAISGEWKAQLRYPIKILARDPADNPKHKLLSAIQSGKNTSSVSAQTARMFSLDHAPRKYKHVAKMSPSPWSLSDKKDIAELAEYANRHTLGVKNFLSSVFLWTLWRLTEEDSEIVMHAICTMDSEDWRKEFFAVAARKMLPQSIVEEQIKNNWSTWGSVYIPYLKDRRILDSIVDTPAHRFKYQGIGVLLSRYASSEQKQRCAERLLEMIKSEWNGWIETSWGEQARKERDFTYSPSSDEIYAKEAIQKFSMLKTFADMHTPHEAAQKTIAHLERLAPRSYDRSDPHASIKADPFIKNEDPQAPEKPPWSM